MESGQQMDGKKIIIAEASSTLKSVADTLLRQNGYDVVCTSDGIQAWEVIQAERPDLAIIGLNLSGMSGIELCRQMSGDQIAGGIPTLLFVGARDNISDEQLMATGARGHLKKPFSPKDLLDSVTRLIGPSGAAGIGSGKKSSDETGTSYEAEVLSTSGQVDGDSSKMPTLNWTDVEDLSDEPESSPQKVASLDAGSDDQELIIEEDQFGLIGHKRNNLAAAEDTPEPSEDEDYDWFIGEMKKEVEGVGGKPPQETEPSEQKGSDFPGLMSDNEVRFDDLGGGKQAVESEKKRSASGSGKAAGSKDKGKSAGSISEGEIEKIADRVVQKLAASIASNIDRKALIAAIKSVIKS